MDTYENPPGLYGKVTTHGDFITRRLPPLFVNAWDLWLQHGIAASRDKMKKQWLETYLTSPLWRFVLAPGVIGETGWTGIWMPSVDKVGRHFPLTIACEAVGECRIYEWLRDAQSWYANLEDLALGALEEGFSLDVMDTTLQNTLSLNAMLALNRPAPPAPPPACNAGVCYSWREFSELEQALPLINLEMAQLTLRDHSFWWSEGSQRVYPSLAVCRGMPSPEQFCAMLDGTWDQSDWQWR